jgi:4-hydroxysphinganine ceramide fatty acyl 2-hydroxylase
MIVTFFRHGSNAILALGIVAAAVAFFIGAVPFSLVGALIGAAVFFVSEYTTHRFLFHAQPSKIPFVLKLQHKLHYDPPQIDLLFLPWWFVVPTVVVYYGVFLAVVRSPALAVSLAFGSVCALLYYEWVHYIAHIPFNPVTPFGRYVKKYHLWHHFKNEHFWYGVTNPSMDFVGATYRDVESVDRSTTVREIWRGM